MKRLGMIVHPSSLLGAFEEVLEDPLGSLDSFAREKNWARRSEMSKVFREASKVTNGQQHSARLEGPCSIFVLDLSRYFWLFVMIVSAATVP